MMTYNEKHHWVFPLVPTDSAYAKLNDYFGGMQKGKLRFCRFGGFLGPFGSSRSNKNQKPEVTRKGEKIQIDHFRNEIQFGIRLREWLMSFWGGGPKWIKSRRRIARCGKTL